MKNLVLYFFIVSVTIACDDDDLLPKYGQLQAAHIFSLTVDTTHYVEANGIGFYTVSATFKSNVLQEKRRVVFTSDIGYFSSGKKSVEVVANEKGIATAFLYSDSVGTGNVKATVAETYVIDHPVQFYAAKAVFAVAFGSLEIQADGLTNSVISVTFDPSVPVQKQTVKLTTTRGVFSNGSKEIDLIANTSRVASTSITGDEIGGAVVQFLQEGRVIAEQVIQFVSPLPDFEFVVDREHIVPADNDSVYRIEVKFLKFHKPEDRMISLETTLGTFHNNENRIDILANNDSVAIAFLKSDRIGMATVKGTFKQKYSQETVLSFKKALPDFITITSPQFSLASGLENKIALETTLSRFSGVPSDGFTIAYQAVDTVGAPVGMFMNRKLSGVDGKATVDYTAGPDKTASDAKTYRGRVTIRATLNLPGNKVLKDSVFLFVVDP